MNIYMKILQPIMLENIAEYTQGAYLLIRKCHCYYFLNSAIFFTHILSHF